MRPKAEFQRAAQYLRVSSEMQGDSIEGQRQEIAAFALRFGFEIVRSFEDRGRSGLLLAGRPALQDLLAEVIGGAPDYSTILVQDVSRWGRFQDPDEAAHYEFLCRAAGVEVTYCSEGFGTSPSPARSVLKAVKRLMAAEFSRELSGKTRRAQRRWAQAGYKMGGVPGYGLRRRLVGADAAPLAVLGPGEAKLLQGQRVILELGPPEEVATVRRIYRLYLEDGLSFRAIADRLNGEGRFGENGRPWGDWTIAQVLGNGKYAGDYRYGRRRRQFDGRRVDAPRDDLIVVRGALPPIISRETFEAVRERRRQRVMHMSASEMLAGAADLLAQGGRLSLRRLETADSLPAYSTLSRHLGPLNRLHARLGAYPIQRRGRGPSHPPLLPGCIDPHLDRCAQNATMPPTDLPPTERPSTYTAFAGDRRLAAGALGEVAPAVKAAHDAGQLNLIVFDDATGKVVDLDLRGSTEDVLARLSTPAEPAERATADSLTAPSKPSRGRPKLGVAAREVTLLPRHWSWLANQPGGASAAIRRLVEQAARESEATDAARAAQTAAYQVMYALAGHLRGYEEALRALFAPDPARFAVLIAPWPADIAAYVGALASRAFAEPSSGA